ncbi:SMP-30/gluconolactonase/LRE family protein [Paracoccus tibetensis]|uniref:Sugar lactone lactonase YvrE n=1 Tax=Paracoccus tibetensis TaxID=336292 RepID=A0A1G5K8Q6_9RHOB|nr:SMP-30/gluconolactonase/LRE family protein [Paracoccus tibetensis]SCY97033.1 Sugar lactone lactonase YvrE [Paracoccus tibetensis]
MTTRVEVAYQSNNRLGETPLWCGRTNRLWWVDIEEPTLHCLDPASGVHKQQSQAASFLGSCALCETGGLLLAVDLGLHHRRLPDVPLVALAQVEKGLDNRLNDGRVDQRGRLWIGTMDNALHRPNGSLYRVDPDGTVVRAFGDVIVSNGIAFSPQGTTLYFTDTRRHRTWSFDLDLDDGVLHNRRPFADFTSDRQRPDGTCIDQDGCIWMAFFGGGTIGRYTPGGRLDRVIELPVTNPTCLCFGGSELDTLYVTTAWKFLTDEQRAAEPLAGSLLAIEGVGKGLPENRFAL